MNTDSEQSGSSPAGTGEARLLFFYIFFIVNIWTTETNFISINTVIFSTCAVYFVIQLLE